MIVVSPSINDMTEDLKYNPDFLKKRWLAYFDLLRTKNLIKSKSIIKIFSVYERAIEEVSKNLKHMPKIDSTWFSDTFLMFSSDDKKTDLGEIDHVALWFVYFLINSSIPVRGAISFGDFYADKSNSLYFGKALVEAYEYGEAQDWIGLLLCPSSIICLDSIGLPANKRLNYAYWPIPFTKKMDNLLTELPACILGNWITINNRNPCIEKIEEMRKGIDQDSISRKYIHTLEFIKKSERHFIVKG